MIPARASPIDLLNWNAALMAQWRALALAFQGIRPGRFALRVGPHLRHVLEHHEALLRPAVPGCIRYDERPRDREAETQPAMAARRLERIERLLGQPQALPTVDEPLVVELRIGLHGEQLARLATTFGRELQVVGSHAVHHLALVVDACEAEGIALPAHAGRAPATVAHDRATRLPTVPLQEIS